MTAASPAGLGRRAGVEGGSAEDQEWSREALVLAAVLAAMLAATLTVQIAEALMPCLGFGFVLKAGDSISPPSFLPPAG